MDAWYFLCITYKGFTMVHNGSHRIGLTRRFGKNYWLSWSKTGKIIGNLFDSFNFNFGWQSNWLFLIGRMEFLSRQVNQLRRGTDCWGKGFSEKGAPTRIRGTSRWAITPSSSPRSSSSSSSRSTGSLSTALGSSIGIIIL